MDTLTHALSGALLARATHRPDRGGLSLPERTLAGFLAAAFPDIDYALFWIDPANFLNWHRALTHSLVLLPLWAWLLAASLAWLRGGHSWKAYYGVCVLGLLVHIAGDVITVYGTQLFFPLSDTAWSWGVSFDINPYIGAIIAAGLVASWVKPPLVAAAITALALGAFLLFQVLLQERAAALGREHAVRLGWPEATVHAIPQPLSPFHWNVLLVQDDRYGLAHLDFLARSQRPDPPADAWLPLRMLAGYQPPMALQWRRYSRFGDDSADPALAERVWEQEALAAFRRFAVLPALYRIDRDPDGICVWFTDLRHIFPHVVPSFRHGLCRQTDAERWHPYRLRYFSSDARQAL
ncbi:MAG: metal-dependent hydrolase [Candidatus Competibacteraceae bacterium]|nr:MAG: metal-dependent hydrolase [Candidatus Competibacteraceae bacterium]